MAFLGQEEQIRELQDRFKLLYAAVFVALGLLTFRLIFLQILNGDKMRQYSEENRIKRVKVPAPRGMIFDRNRVLLVDNRLAFDLEVIPQYLSESKQTTQVVALISKLLKLPESDLWETLEKYKRQPPFLPVKLKEDLNRDEVALIESYRINLPGVQIAEEIKRTNVFNDVGAHQLGYIGEVNATEYPSLLKQGKNYKLGDKIGKFGLEQMMEDVLRGLDGEKLVEVDALGRTRLTKARTKVVKLTPDKSEVPGRNLILTLDQDLQLAAVKAFEKKSGGVVAIDPRSGEILAMVSRPSFDPTVFSRGIPAALWQELISNENRPMGDKTIQDHYPPGSVFKPVTAIAGLEEGVIDENTRYVCTGSVQFGNRPFHCHWKRGHGELNVVQAIQQSCDVFFYRVAQKLKSVDQIAKWATFLGFGRKTGVPLAREVPGLVPTEDWKMKRFNEPWNPGETLSVAIGQGFMLSTAIQLATVYASIANGGTHYRPFLVKRIEDIDGQTLTETQPEVINKHILSEKTRKLVLEGLYGVVNNPGGTAIRSRLPGMDFVGKTGTVQLMRLSAEKLFSKCVNMKYKNRHHGIFAGFAPKDNPVIAVAVIAEHACSGSGGAAPIAKEIVQTYLRKFDPSLYSPQAILARYKAEGKPIPYEVKQSMEDIREDLSPDEIGPSPLQEEATE